jgi:AAA domain/RNase_H superfamily
VAKRRADDHLSLVAGISKNQISELKDHGVETLTALANLALPLPWKPERGSAESLERMREQARIQLTGREAGETIFELLPIMPGFGLARLPAPSEGDIFLDLEGDPFIGDGGFEYLFGYAWRDAGGAETCTADWSFSRTDERAAFERFIDFVIARLEQYPDLHIYHYAPYEPAALKRLMGRYATRENEVDRLLRSQTLVDLFGVVRHAVRASVESYSIKKLEPLFGFERAVALMDANRTLSRVQACLELGDPEAVTDEDRASVQGYNRDDCLSTWRLRDWLEELRREQLAAGAAIDRPSDPDGAAPEAIGEWQARVEALVERLAVGIPDDEAERSEEQRARWTLAQILDFHRREQKALWWEHFRLADLDEEELLDERAALSGLTFEGRVGGTDKAPIHRYRYPPQETLLRGDEDLRSLGGEKHGAVVAISLEGRYVDIKKRGDTASVHPAAVYSHTIIRTDVLAEALMRLGEYVADNGLEGEGPYQAARDLLLRASPRIVDELLQKPDEPAGDAAIRIALHLDGGVLAIQGPPGAGKTHAGAWMVSTLANAGAKVGITANSHKVIRNLLDECIKSAGGSAAAFACIQKVSEMEDAKPPLQFTKDNPKFFAAMAGSCSVGAGTAWLWARPEAFEALDVLVVDEAAQMSLANVLAISQAARQIVLLGDPQQLDQPMQGSHPEGTDTSALNHIIGDEHTIPEGRGLFLAETWRLHPEICRFTSEVFYGGRLHSRPGLEIQRVRSTGRVDGVGLRYAAVAHTGNQSSSPEEALEVQRLVEDILSTGSTWIDNDGVERAITLDDILIIAPYNAQVFEIQARLPGARIGTVDKFQGQQAAVVIYSMTTSSHADAPRGMEFLYSLNRLNVATSRAKCVCILVASPSVFEADCRTPRQMQLANAFCRYLELATEI